jgi:hypothetical protein
MDRALEMARVECRLQELRSRRLRNRGIRRKREKRCAFEAAPAPYLAPQDGALEGRDARSSYKFAPEGPTGVTDFTPSELGASTEDRMRTRSPALEDGISFFASGDNLRDGSALNTVQVAEYLLGVGTTATR